MIGPESRADLGATPCGGWRGERIALPGRGWIGRKTGGGARVVSHSRFRCRVGFEEEVTVQGAEGEEEGEQGVAGLGVDCRDDLDGGVGAAGGGGGAGETRRGRIIRRSRWGWRGVSQERW